MKDNGFIKLSRKFFQNSYWTQKRTFSLSEAWLDLIQMARFDAEPTHILLPNGRQITIERGEIHASLRFLSLRWGWSVEKTLRYINKHMEKQEIERRTEQGESILRLCNYDSYNPLSNTDQNTDPNSDQNTDQTPTITNNKKDKKVKKEKENKESPNGDEKVSFDFFWEQYHEVTGIEKTDKAAAEKHWNKLKEPEKKKAIDRIPDYWAYVSGRKGKDGKVFVKKARTYLADKNFDDDYGKSGSTSSVRLGPKEWIGSDGKRYYGFDDCSHPYSVPMDAPPRPDEKAYFDKERGEWWYN